MIRCGLRNKAPITLNVSSARFARRPAGTATWRPPWKNPLFNRRYPMTTRRQTRSRRTALMARLLGGASLAVLAAYGPAMAQAVDITVDSAQTAPDDVFTAANVTGFDTVGNNTQESRAAVEASIADGVLNSDIAGSGSSSVGIE